MDMTVGKDYGTALEEMKMRIEMTKKRSMSVKKQTKKKAKKKLKYNSREIATQLAQTTRSIGAGQVLIRASDKLAQLQKMAVTGDYDMNEMRAAIAHARSMVKCARLKKNHLLEEENVEREGKKKRHPDNVSKEQRAKQIVQRELSKMRRRNRLKEKGKVDEAERRYHRDQNRSSYAEERAVYAEAYRQAYREAYRQACREAGVSVAAEGGGESVSAASSAEAAMAVDASAAAPAPAASVDICI